MKFFLKYILLPMGILILAVGINFIVVKRLDQQLPELEGFYGTDKAVELPRLLPSQFIDGARFYVNIPTKKDKSLLGFCDTGGGLSLIFEHALEKHNLGSITHTGILRGLMPLNYVLFEDLVSDNTFPSPQPIPSFTVRTPLSRIDAPHLLVPPMDEETKFITQSMPDMEAFLGQGFFMNRAWTIDYPSAQIWVNTPLSESDLEFSNVQRIGLKKNSHGQPVFGHASMKMEVDGEEIDVLFDTGATMVLSENGKKELNTNRQTVAGSFIATSIMNQWRERHPDWKFYPGADHNRDVIEVPVVNIGGHAVGPVLFSERPDENWSEGMIHSMDKVVKGAIGGSALQYLKVTVDFNSELIKFEQS